MACCAHVGLMRANGICVLTEVKPSRCSGHGSIQTLATNAIANRLHGVIKRIDVACVIQNDKDVNDRFRLQTWNGSAAHVMDSENAIAKNCSYYSGLFLECLDPMWFVFNYFNHSRHFTFL